MHVFVFICVNMNIRITPTSSKYFYVRICMLWTFFLVFNESYLSCISDELGLSALFQGAEHVDMCV